MTNSRGIRADAYPTDPVGYARDVLGIILTPDQQAAALSLLQPPYRTLIVAATAVGKTYLAAAMVNWWFDSFNPCTILTTAPNERCVKILLWKDVRVQRMRAGLSMPFIGPAAPEMRTSQEHVAMGFVSQKGQTFKGSHAANMLFIFDEADLIDRAYYTLTESMFVPGDHHAWLCIFNPTSTDSAVYDLDHGVDEDRGDWHRFRLSAFTHPNIIHELECRPEPLPCPKAVSVPSIEMRLKSGCEKVREGDQDPATDFQWPPPQYQVYSQRTGKQPQWYRPGPEFNALVRGMWPTESSGVWSDHLFEKCLQPLEHTFPLEEPPQLGVDCSQGKANDWFAVHGRWGAISLLHDTSNTMDAVRIFERVCLAVDELADVARQHRPAHLKPFTIHDLPIKIDDDGTGNAVAAMLRRKGYLVRLIGAGKKAMRDDRYPNIRSELWFYGRDVAAAGGVYLGRLDAATLRRLRQQLLAPVWDLLGRKRVVEPKDDTKAKIGRSPDDADAFLLAHYQGGGIEAPSGVDTPRRNMTPHAQQGQPQRSERQESERQHYQQRPERRQWGLHRRS